MDVFFVLEYIRSMNFFASYLSLCVFCHTFHMYSHHYNHHHHGNNHRHWSHKLLRHRSYLQLYSIQYINITGVIYSDTVFSTLTFSKVEFKSLKSYLNFVSSYKGLQVQLKHKKMLIKSNFLPEQISVYVMLNKVNSPYMKQKITIKKRVWIQSASRYI